jgi:hypothetical protein
MIMSDDERGKMRVVVFAGRGKGRGFSPTKSIQDPGHYGTTG